MELKFRRLAISCLNFNSHKISVHTSQYIWDTCLGVSVRKELDIPPTSVLQISLDFILETFLFSDSNTSNPLWVLFYHQSTSGRLAKLNSTTHAREINVNGPGIQLSLSSESIPRTQVIVANTVVNFNKKFLTTLPPYRTHDLPFTISSMHRGETPYFLANPFELFSQCLPFTYKRRISQTCS